MNTYQNCILLLKCVWLADFLSDAGWSLFSDAFPLDTNIINRNFQSREKKNLNILAECDMECKDEKTIKDYEILLEFDYENEGSNKDDSYDDLTKPRGKVKSCVQTCKIISSNKTSESGSSRPTANPAEEKSTATSLSTKTSIPEISGVTPAAEKRTETSLSTMTSIPEISAVTLVAEKRTETSLSTKTSIPEISEVTPAAEKRTETSLSTKNSIPEIHAVTPAAEKRTETSLSTKTSIPEISAVTPAAEKRTETSLLTKTSIPEISAVTPVEEKRTEASELSSVPEPPTVTTVEKKETEALSDKDRTQSVMTASTPAPKGTETNLTLAARNMMNLEESNFKLMQTRNQFENETKENNRKFSYFLPRNVAPQVHFSEYNPILSLINSSTSKILSEISVVKNLTQMRLLIEAPNSVNKLENSSNSFTDSVNSSSDTNESEEISKANLKQLSDNATQDYNSKAVTSHNFDVNSTTPANMSETPQSAITLNTESFAEPLKSVDAKPIKGFINPPEDIMISSTIPNYFTNISKFNPTVGFSSSSPTPQTENAKEEADTRNTSKIVKANTDYTQVMSNVTASYFEEETTTAAYEINSTFTIVEQKASNDSLHQLELLKDALTNSTLSSLNMSYSKFNASESAAPTADISYIDNPLDTRMDQNKTVEFET